MKKTILLTAITIISVMTASNTFAQYNDQSRDNKGYNSNGYHTAYNQDKFKDMREIRRDQDKVNDDLQSIAQIKKAIYNDTFHGFSGRYRQDQAELQRLNSKLARDRFEFAKDCRYAHIDERVASRF